MNQYLDRNQAYLDQVPLYEFNGPVSVKAMDIASDFGTSFFEEIVQHCKEQGHEVDKVVFFTAYAGDVLDNQVSIKSDSHFYVKVIKTLMGKLVAVVFCGAYVEAGDWIEYKSPGQ